MNGYFEKLTLLIRIKYKQETSNSVTGVQRSKSGFEDVELEVEGSGKQDTIHHQISFKGESQLAVITRKCKKGGEQAISKIRFDALFPSNHSYRRFSPKNRDLQKVLSNC